LNFNQKKKKQKFHGTSLLKKKKKKEGRKEWLGGKQKVGAAPFKTMETIKKGCQGPRNDYPISAAGHWRKENNWGTEFPAEQRKKIEKRMKKKTRGPGQNT